jgi:serine/threonine protein kinase
MSPPEERFARDDLIGCILAGGFHVVAQIARGGVSSVYRTEGSDGTLAVLKVLDPLYRDLPMLRRRFIREAELSAYLEGCSVPRVLATGEVKRRPYQLLEYLAGRSLADRWVGEKPSVSEALAITSGLLEALAGLHERGIVHCDIKPANVMLLDDGSIRLLDLGLARIVPRELTAQGMGREPGSGGGGRPPSPGPELLALDERSPNDSPGTPAYMSPEQAEGSVVDGRSDLYAVGLLLFEMLTQRRPFPGDPIQTLNARLTQAAPPLRTLVPALSPELEQVAMQALARSPAERFPDATAMSAALAQVPERTR